MVGLGWGAGCSQELLWVLRKGEQAPACQKLLHWEEQKTALWNVWNQPPTVPIDLSMCEAVGSQQLVCPSGCLYHHILAMSLLRQVPSTFL